MRSTYIAIAIAALLIGGPLVLARGFGGSGAGDGKNVSMEGEKQVILITAKGGYAPSVTPAKAGVPTLLRVETKGTFDCSSALVIPEVGFRDYLPSSGVKEIEIPPQKPGAEISGRCAMGMYSFSIKFEE